MTVLELERGVPALEHHTPSKGEALRNWLNGVRLTFKNNIFPFTGQTAEIGASLYIPNPRSERDAMIAATAIEHGFRRVTRNVADFERTGLRILNPWLHGEQSPS